MHFSEFKHLVKSDLYRYSGSSSGGAFVKTMLRAPGFNYSFWMRLCAYLRQQRLLRHSLYYFALLFLEHAEFKFGISIGPSTKIGEGFYIGHFGGIVINPNSVIGKNCNISQGVTLGQANRGKNKGYPVIGDNVYIGPGAKIVGAVRIGNDVAIGANCVVTKDIPDHAVVVGVPGRIISDRGSEGYIHYTEY